MTIYKEGMVQVQIDACTKRAVAAPIKPYGSEIARSFPNPTRSRTFNAR